jgi:amino acid transporter
MGELLAWIIGWDLLLEYRVAVAAVAVGWGAYLTELLDSLFGITLSDSISLPPGEGGDVNVPSALLVLSAAGVLIAGVRQSARSNTVMVITKLGVLAFFIVVAHGVQRRPFLRLRTKRFRRHRVGGRAHLLRVHRLRRGFDRQRGVPRAQT